PRRSMSPLVLAVVLAAPVAPSARPSLEPLRATARRIVAHGLASDGAFGRLEHLCDRIGHRLTGSGALVRAVAWAEAALRAEGHDAVRAEPVRVRHWSRGAIRAEV